MTKETLRYAVALAQAGQKNQAQALLQQALSENPRNETAWLWLADCAASNFERIQVLETCLRFVPDSQTARTALAALRGQTGTGPDPSSPNEESLSLRPPSSGKDLSQSETGKTPLAEVAPYPPAEGDPVSSDVSEGLAEEEEEEWPKLRDQIQLEPWMLGLADEAGPALGALLGNQEESGGLPGRARAYDNLPTLPAHRPETPPAFTVAPDEVSNEEFIEVERRTQAKLRNRPIIRPLKVQKEPDWFDPDYRRTEDEVEQEEQSNTMERQPSAEELPSSAQGSSAQEEKASPARPGIAAAPRRSGSTIETRTGTLARRVALYGFLILLGLILITAFLAIFIY